MSLITLLKHRCTIRRNTPANVNGIITPAWANVAAGVRCLLQEGKGEIQKGPAGQGLEYDAICYFLPSADVRPAGPNDQSDQIVMTTPSRLSGVTLLVVHVADTSGQTRLQNAYVRRLPSKI